MLTLIDTQKCTLTAVALDGKGNPADLSSVVWISSDPTIVAVGVPWAASVDITAVGPLGSARITATAGAIVATLDITVVGGAAVSLVINTSAPIEQ